jgi:hypothetical protein
LGAGFFTKFTTSGLVGASLTGGDHMARGLLFDDAPTTLPTLEQLTTGFVINGALATHAYPRPTSPRTENVVRTMLPATEFSSPRSSATGNGSVDLSSPKFYSSADWALINGQARANLGLLPEPSNMPGPGPTDRVVDRFVNETQKAQLELEARQRIEVLADMKELQADGFWEESIPPEKYVEQMTPKELNEWVNDDDPIVRAGGLDFFEELHPGGVEMFKEALCKQVKE